MGNIENYKAKLPEITAIKDEDIITTYRIPLEIYIREAESLYAWSQDDRDALITNAGLDWNIVEDIPILAGALKEADFKRVACLKAKQDNIKSRKKRFVEFINLRNRLLHEFRFAFRRNPIVKEIINTISTGKSYTNVLQNLTELSLLGKKHPDELRALNFDTDILDVAVKSAKEMTDALTVSTIEDEYDDAKKIRDQAFTLLKLNVNKVCRCGHYLFWQNEQRKIGYTSAYPRSIRNKRTENDADIANGPKTIPIEAGS
jgi:hypothetical protein